MTDMDEHHLDALPPVDQSAEHNTKAPLAKAPEASHHETQATTGLEQSPSGFVDPSVPGGTGLPPLSSVPSVPIVGVDGGSAQAPPGVPVSPQAATPLIADDADLIEKEWVLKAKQIVEHTKHDPYRQNEEMTKMKVDYLSKRYGRDIKESKG